MKKLTDAEIDARIRRYHDVACRYQIKADALGTRLNRLRLHLESCAICRGGLCADLKRLIYAAGEKA
jgi:hypothetical protein